MGQRTFEKHVALYAAYADAVAALPAAAWDRLTTACGALEGESFGALLRRARLGAKPYNTLELFAAHSPALKGIAAVTTAAVTGIGVAFELIGEFERRASPSSTRSSERATNPRYGEYVDAWLAIESALHSIQESHPGVAVAIRAAGQAVLRHDWLSAEAFAAVYGFVESEIPYATLDRGADAV